MNLLCISIFDEDEFHEKDFERKLINSISLIYFIHIIHDPTDDQRRYLRIGCGNSRTEKMEFWSHDLGDLCPHHPR